MATVTLEVQARGVLGKHVKKLRRQGIVPANIYGRHADSVPIQLTERQLDYQVARHSRTTLYTLDGLGSGPVTVLVQHLQRHPTTGRFLHVDFLRLTMTEKLHASVPLHFVGESLAVDKLDGTLLHNLTTLEVECLPGDLPTMIEVDVSTLDSLDSAIHVRDLNVPAGVEVLTSGDEIVANVAAPRVEAAEEAATPEEAGAPAQAPAEAPAASAQS